MSHVLLGGDEQKVAELRSLLVQWGVTVGQLAFAGEHPTIQACDAVIVQGNTDKDEDSCLGTLPDGPGGAAGPAAPLIFIAGEGQSTSTRPAAWLVLDRVDSNGGNLRLALQSACAEARARRDNSAAPAATETPTDDHYIHFLGHELRSPLTAIKTALEVMSGELDDADQGHTPPRFHMLDIAMRNVRRLHETVEWSQDLLAARELPCAVNPRAVAVTELRARLQEFSDVTVTEAALDRELDTDPDLLANMATQMTRVLKAGCPEHASSIRLGIDPDDPHLFQMVVAATGGAGDSAPLPGHRACLVPTGVCNGTEARVELDRLARFMIASRLLGQLGAELRSVWMEDAQPALVLTLKLQPAPVLSH